MPAMHCSYHGVSVPAFHNYAVQTATFDDSQGLTSCTCAPVPQEPALRGVLRLLQLNVDLNGLQGTGAPIQMLKRCS